MRRILHGLALVTAVTIPASPSVAAPPVPSASVAPADGKTSWWDLLRALNSTKYPGFSAISHFTAPGAGPDTARPDDPCTDAAPVGAEPSEATGTAGPVASVTLQKGDDGPTVSETLTAVGAEAAGDTVEQIEEILDRCPVTEDDAYRTTFSRWAAPEVGDASVGYTLVIESKAADRPSVSFTTAVVAHDDVLAHFTMTDGEAADAAQLKKIVRNGTRELADISTVPPT
ncbi:hypothetical protein HH310_22640 [Actinoplanes sp. TBRC 11911]|uniref:hypothetical protein n=1 Tax=Actinoplanes sp. TBRC 11911 TaxID=2729386 RepID=UPI00145C4674|nr:hypothetical protein [Actinoplanes sp. TBRC 11911]NMO53966.1 hypothetical protein [Actinoplanes sp. TBRC 11911]